MHVSVDAGIQDANERHFPCLEGCCLGNRLDVARRELCCASVCFRRKVHDTVLVVPAFYRTPISVQLFLLANEKSCSFFPDLIGASFFTCQWMMSCSYIISSYIIVICSNNTVHTCSHCQARRRSFSAGLFPPPRTVHIARI